MLPRHLRMSHGGTNFSTFEQLFHLFAVPSKALAIWCSRHLVPQMSLILLIVKVVVVELYFLWSDDVITGRVSAPN